MGAVKHVALIKFKASASPALVNELWNEIKRLPSLVPGITDFAGGLNNSPEGLNQGLTHGFVMTFKDAAARDAYLPHPEHEQVKAKVLPHVESVMVFDFEV